MPRRFFYLAILALAGCGSDDPPATARARDLQTRLNPAPPPIDAAKQRADSQFNTCLYVYDSAEKLRECLVLRFEWSPEEAARRIAINTAEVRRLADTAIQRQIDSAKDALAAREDAARAAQRRREDAARRQEVAAAAAAAYWGSRKAKVYYTNTPNCSALRLIQRGDRQLFSSKKAAQVAGYTRAEDPGC